MAKALYGHLAFASRGPRAGWMGGEQDILHSRLVAERGELLRRMGELSRNAENGIKSTSDADVVTAERIASPKITTPDIGVYAADKAEVELVLPEPELASAVA